MNSSFNKELLKKNLNLFNSRFPAIYHILDTQISLSCENIEVILPKNIEILETKSGATTIKYNGTLLHSSYDPIKEAERLALNLENSIKQEDTFVFNGVGLGYLPQIVAKKFKTKAIIIIEPDPSWIILSFLFVDWTPVFSQQQCFFLLNALHHSVISILEKQRIDNCLFINNQAWALHAATYFDSLIKLIDRNKQKKAINDRTLETFASLWFRNICMNINETSLKDGITRFQDKATDIPACVIAAGPTLTNILPYLNEIKKRAILICVDTALRPCLNAGIEPHFIILADPQYWNARHLDRLEAPNSILITESSTYPSVFRFKCKEILLCSSMFPLGQYLEKEVDLKGTLGAGGSVASTAWDFARFCGCKEILMAGLDLSFPNGKTHATGSTFEEKAHMFSNRIKNAETTITQALYGAYPCIEKDYLGNSVKTDKRMSLYSWWFESKCIQYPTVSTKTLTPQSLYIPGISIENTENIVRRESIQKRIDEFYTISSSSSEEKIKRQEKLKISIKTVTIELQKMLVLVEQALRICGKKYKNTTEFENAIKDLSKIDKTLLSSKVSELAALLFPTKEQLTKKLDEEPCKVHNLEYSDFENNIHTSKIIYGLLKESIRKWLEKLM